MTAQTNAVLGEKQVYSENLKITFLPGIGNPGNFPGSLMRYFGDIE